MATQPTQTRTPNVQETLANLGQNKRLVMLGAIVVMVVIAVIIVVFAWTKGTSKGGEIELVKRLDQDRAFEIITKLKTENIQGIIGDSDLPGKINIKVFQKDFDKAALLIARSDLLQEAGFNLFDKSDWAASDYDKRIKMMRAINGDLSRIVSRMTGIKWATVRVNVPEPQLFSQYQASTTATVQIEIPDSDIKLTRTQVKSIVNLLVGYVPNLQRNNISVVDTNGQSYSSVETEEIASSELLEETEKINQIIQKRIEEYLEPLIGFNNFVVRVSSEISRRKIEESSTTFTHGAVGQEQVGDERLGNAPGTEAAAVGPQISGVEGNKGYTRLNKVTQNYPSFKQRNVTTPPGTVSRISVAIAINRSLPAGVSMKQLREGIAAITSPTTTSEDVRITVAEFARAVSQKDRMAKPVALSLPNVGDFVSKVVGFFKGLPIWANVAIGIIGLWILVGSFRRPVAPQPSTVSQITQQQMQRQQLQRQPEQIPPAERPMGEIPAKEPDLTGILTGLKEAATERPDYLANKLQIWLEEGATASRI